MLEDLVLTAVNQALSQADAMMSSGLSGITGGLNIPGLFQVKELNNFSKPIDTLIKELSRLPGIGQKTAQRLAFHIINMPKEDVNSLSDSIIQAKSQIQFCSICQNIADSNPCEICSSKERTDEIICVVESPREVMAMEKSKEYSKQK